jgi:uncharacterized membrane protein
VEAQERATAPMPAGPMRAEAAGGLALPVRRVDLDRPWAWLAAGWRDLRAAPEVGLAYGVAFAAAGFLITFGLWRAGLWYAVLPMTCGFLILGPLAAVGLYEASRQLGRGQRPTLVATLAAFRANAGQIALMGLALLLFFFAWVRLAVMIFYMFFGLRPPSLEHFLADVLLAPQSIVFVIVGFGTGAVLAAIAFSISVVAIPLLLDRPQAHVVAAIVTSVQAVLRNPLTLGLWAALIVLFTFAGLATLYLGLIVALPLIGHASWHAYRDLVGAGDPPGGAP